MVGRLEWQRNGISLETDVKSIFKPDLLSFSMDFAASLVYSSLFDFYRLGIKTFRYKKKRP